MYGVAKLEENYDKIFKVTRLVPCFYGRNGIGSSPFMTLIWIFGRGCIDGWMDGCFTEDANEIVLGNSILVYYP